MSSSLREPCGLRRALGVLVLVVLVAVGCGGTVARTTPRPSAATATPAPADGGAVSGAGEQVLADASSVGLHVVATGGLGGAAPGLHCPIWIDRADQVVLATSQLTYSAGDLTAMARDLSNAHVAPSPSSPLRAVPGVLVSSAADLMERQFPGSTSFIYGPGCSIQLQITSQAQTAIQVSQAGMRVNGNPESNTQQYRLVDQCTVRRPPPSNCYPQLGGGPGPCDLYSVGAQLPASRGALVTDAPAASQGCPPMTVNPGRTVELTIDVVSPTPLVYSITPVLVVRVTSGPRTVAVPSATGTAAYADGSQFSCYRLNGTTFTLATQGSQVLNWRTWQNSAWCL